ncbi:bifunctional adenosylcobinamide kinase/adenosylcobinamide-phosphate guanylyltransferase [Microlunatus spumicola]|uniref:Adenosylcobinamide kinase n=1 Tax=Microlunatus spumicola TaxID=81499 RepID=A0ABP6XHG8_9ACTN
MSLPASTPSSLPASAPAQRTLVTGGSRSGKSRFAEGLLAREEAVTYVAPGPVPDPVADAEWAARVRTHQERRPEHWTTVETTDVAEVLRRGDAAYLVDCLGTWVTAVIDRMGTWDVPLGDWQGDFDAQVTDLVDAWQSTPKIAVAVTNEVGWGLVSEHRSGRVFTDLLGQVNAAVAGASEDVVLMVAGRALYV